MRESETRLPMNGIEDEDDNEDENGCCGWVLPARGSLTQPRSGAEPVRQISFAPN
jgi:hypothetical protein